MIHSEPSASRPRNARVPVAARRQPARRSAASRPDSADSGRWKVQLELAPAEIAFVYRQGLARGAEVCRRGSHDWRPLVTTPELREALAKRASLAEMIEVAPSSGAALPLHQTLAITDPALAALTLARRAPQVPKSAPPPPPAVSKSTPPPALKSTPLAFAVRQLEVEPTSSALLLPPPLVRTDSVPDWEDTPLLPLRVAPLLPPPVATLKPMVEVAVHHARPLELSLVAALAVVLTLWVTALTLQAEAPRLNALVSSISPSTPRPAPPVHASFVEAPPHSTIPVVLLRDLPVQGSGASAAFVGSSQAPSGAGFTASAGPSRAALSRALAFAAAAARSCGTGPVTAQVVVTFAPSGVARDIHFTAAPPVALRSCVLNAVARTHLAPFSGEPVTVSKTLRW